MEIRNNIIITTGHELINEVIHQLILNNIEYSEQINIDISDPKCIVISQPSKEVAGDYIENKPLSKNCEYYNSDNCDCVGNYCEFGQLKH